MKRNLISVIILALSIINFIMLAIIVFTVIPTNKKTDNLITSIASIIDLSVENSGEESGAQVALTDLTIYTLADDMIISLKSDDGDTHYATVKVAISMNTTSDDFKTYDPAADTGISAKDSVIMSTVDGIISKYSAAECTEKKEEIAAECSQAIKDLFKSDVIYDVSFSKYLIS